MSCLTIVLVRTKCHLFYRMAFIFSACLLSFTMKFSMDFNRLFVDDDEFGISIKNWLKIGNSIASRVKWILIYYFVIIVREIKIKIAAKDPEEYAKTLRRHKIVHIAIFTLFIVSQLSLFSVHLVENIYLVRIKSDDN